MADVRRASQKVERRTITEADRLRLIGVLTVTTELNKRIRDLERAAVEIVGEPDDGSDYYGHVSDAAWDHRSDGLALANEVIRRLDIRVVEDE